MKRMTAEERGAIAGRWCSRISGWVTSIYIAYVLNRFINKFWKA